MVNSWIKTSIKLFLKYQCHFFAKNSYIYLNLASLSPSRFLLTEFFLLFLISLHPRGKKPFLIPLLLAKLISSFLCDVFPLGSCCYQSKSYFRPYSSELWICLSQRQINIFHSVFLYSISQKLQSETRRKQWITQDKSLFLSCANSMCK